MEKLKIGFLSLYSTFSENGYIGVFLVTDENGIPIEFKCTYAVKPTDIHKTLYGDKLLPIISIQKCGIPLLNSINHKPDIIFINEDYILNMRPEIDIPTFYIKPKVEQISLQSQNDASESQVVENSTKHYQQLLVKAHQQFQNELAPLKPTIYLLTNNFDVLEVFDRMKKAVEILSTKDTRFS